MARSRAILTDTERELIRSNDKSNQNRRYQAISRVRSRITDELSHDVRILRENHPELYQELINTIKTDTEGQTDG